MLNKCWLFLPEVQAKDESGQGFVERFDSLTCYCTTNHLKTTIYCFSGSWVTGLRWVCPSQWTCLGLRSQGSWGRLCGHVPVTPSLLWPVL